MPRITVIEGVDSGREFPLNGDSVVIGREAASGIRLFDTEVSRRHAELSRQENGEYRLVDRDSANGLLLNGTLTRDSLLQSGDRIRIGQTLLVYHSDMARTQEFDLAEQISRLTEPDLHLPSAILRRVGESEGSRILAGAEALTSPWLRTRLANLTILYESIQAVSHILDTDQLLDRILELAFQATDADRGCFILLDSDKRLAPPRAKRGRDGNASPLIVSRTISEHVLREREGILIADAAGDERFRGGQSVVRARVREVICVPMKGRHETVGLLYLDTFRSHVEQSRRRFSDDHLDLAIAVAHQAAVAVEETRYYQAMVQSERLAAVGQAVAALSHHIKNILQGLKSGTEILKMGLDGKDQDMLQAGWRILDRNQGRIFDLVMDMLSYSKEREPSREPTDVNSVARSIVELLQPRASERGASISMVLASDLPVAFVDADGIYRALLNLVGNALDATADQEKAKSKSRQPSIKNAPAWRSASPTTDLALIRPFNTSFSIHSSALRGPVEPVLDWRSAERFCVNTAAMFDWLPVRMQDADSKC